MNGASALGLQSILGLGSYRTAWALAAKLRPRWCGPAENGSAVAWRSTRPMWGAQKRDCRLRLSTEKSTGSHRRRGRRRGDRKDRLKPHPRSVQATAARRHPRGCRARQHDRTPSWAGYVGLEALGYRHEYDFLAGSSQSASELLPHVHRVAALLKRWLIGTHQGAVSREHLDYYLDEYTFRRNRRRSRHRGKLFYRLVQQAAYR